MYVGKLLKCMRNNAYAPYRNVITMHSNQQINQLCVDVAKHYITIEGILFFTSIYWKAKVYQTQKNCKYSGVFSKSREIVFNLGNLLL